MTFMLHRRDLGGIGSLQVYVAIFPFSSDIYEKKKQHLLIGMHIHLVSIISTSDKGVLAIYCSRKLR